MAVYYETEAAFAQIHLACPAHVASSCVWSFPEVLGQSLVTHFELFEFGCNFC